MTQINFVGRIPRYIREFVHRAAIYLEIDEEDSIIEIKAVRKFPQNELGMCGGTKEFVSVQYANNSEGRVTSREQRLRAIAHEIVHARQIIDGNLCSGIKGLYWRGRKIENPFQKIPAKKIPQEIKEDLEYLSSPWELEAMALEEDVYETCIL